MIPRRVKLSGFLCYQHEQEISFTDSSLWMLAGLNGSGKSTIFDALTYALFGSHRGGSSNNSELINKESKNLSVEFEFEIEGEIFKILRTLKRDKRTSKGTQNIFHFAKSEGEEGKWISVPDTNLSEGFKIWVQDHIGLSFDIFTSSVLLLQGKAEKLLDAKPSGRAEVLAGIVDLERYQKLHARADDRRKSLKNRLEEVQGQAKGVPEVTDDDLTNAGNKIEDAEHAREIALREITRLQELEFSARQWQTFQGRAAQLQDRWKQGQGLIAKATEIETSYKRWRELKEVIPHVLTIQEKQSELTESERASKEFTLLKEQLVASRGEIEQAIEAGRKKRDALKKTLHQDEEKHNNVSRQLRDLSGALSQLNLYEEQVVKQKQLTKDLSRYPKAPDEDVRKTEAEVDQRQKLAPVIPLLQRFLEAREALKATQTRLDNLRLAETKKVTEGKKAKEEFERITAQTNEAIQVKSRADEVAIAARTLYEQSKQAAEEFAKNEGAKLCRACGQALTPAHFEAEKAARTKAYKAAAAKHKDAVKAQTAALEEETNAKSTALTHEQKLMRLREEYNDARKDREQAEGELTRLTHECRSVYQAISEPYRSRIAPTPPDDWQATQWPLAKDLAHFNQEMADLEPLRARLAQARTTLTQVERIRADLQATQSTMEQVRKLLPPGEPEQLRQKEMNLRAEEEAFNLQVRAAKSQIQESELDNDRRQRELTDKHKTIAEIDIHAATHLTAQGSYRDAIHRALEMIPVGWSEKAKAAGLAEQNRWKSELANLTQQGVEKEYEELSQSRHTVNALKQEIESVNAEIAQISEEARRTPEEIKARITTAKREATAKEEDLNKARQDKAVLDGYREQVSGYSEQIKNLERELNYSKHLTDLLGRDRLQRYLVRTAERQIVDYSNGILDRLSSGQLFLKLCSEEDGKALDLECYNRTTGDIPFNVVFLSGSQRFRVAVALALGIGQYASRGHRPIESVIIDEGFGCLDRQGRQVMIQELQNLRGHLKCILLVSHQEEFFEAFPDSYRFELKDGSTEVMRYQR